jgi:UDP-N-acetylglucosamine:LPS N-acetylglucosamine transferase
MRVLFVAYCFGNYKGQVLIGVYKRSLRIALELYKRGHEIVMYCTGRHAYRDELTEEAEKKIGFLDIPFGIVSLAEAEKIRRNFLKEISRMNPDLVVIGELPLAGAMLEATLCAVELGIPVIFLDNAYNPELVGKFCQDHAPMADGIILTGPSSYLTPEPPPYLCQVPPYIETLKDLGKELLRACYGRKGKKLVTVLAYDGKVEKLGISLLEKLDTPGINFLFLSRDPGKCRRQLKKLPRKKRKRAKVIAPPTDPVLFGLLELSALSVVKHGFMQVTECLALRTPVIMVYYEGPRWLDLLPVECRSFVFCTEKEQADSAVLEKALQYLNLGSTEMAKIHDGKFDAAARSADFIESFPLKPRQETWKEFQAGFLENYFFPIVGNLHPGKKVNTFLLRYMKIRDLPGYRMYSILLGYYLDKKKRFARLWVRTYDTQADAEANYQGEYRDLKESKRHVYYFSAAECFLVEADIGQAELPPL